MTVFKSVMSSHFSILINGHTFSAAKQSGENAEWLNALVHAHGQEATYCTCTPLSPVRLVVKRYGAGTDAVRFGLARWPGTGLEHALTCRFFSEDDDSADALPALEDIGDGKVRIHLAESLTRTLQKGKAAEFARSLAAAEKVAAGAIRRQDLASLELLLRKLWRHAGLNVYRGTPKAWYQIAFALLQAAQRIFINRKGESLADYLYLQAAPGDKVIGPHNAKVAAHAEATGSRMFVLGRLRDYNRDKPKVLLPLIDRVGMPKALVTTELLCRSLGDGSFTRNALDGQSASVVGLAMIEPDGGEWWKVTSLAVLTTSACGIPAESSAEVEFEAHLRESGRSFLRPLQLSAAPNDLAKPSYILLDTPERQRVEIWGSRGECHLRAMDERVREAKESGRPVVGWSANPRQPFPLLGEQVPAQ